MLLAIEGYDGVGKTTIAKRVAAERDLELHLVSGRGTPEWAKQWLGTHFMYFLWLNYLNGKDGGIVDSHVLRTVTSHLALGMNILYARLAVPLMVKIERPDINFLLECDESERLRRLSEKQADAYDLHLGCNYLYLKWAKILNYSLVVIDANPDVDTVVASVLSNSIWKTKS